MRLRWLSQMRDRLGREDWPVLGLFLVIFAIFILGVSSAVSGLEFSLLWPTTFLGLVLGWSLAATAASGGLAVIVSLLLGVPLILVQIGNLLSPLILLITSLVDLLRRALFSPVAPAAASVTTAWRDLASATSILMTRLIDWFLALTRGDPLFDPVAAAVLWLLVLWSLAVWAGWSERRRNQTMLALLPALLLLATMLSLTGSSVLYLAPALALTLVLEATTSQALTEQNWRADEIDFSSRPRRNLTWTVSGLALALLLVALVTPSPSIYRLLDLARDLSSQERDQELARSLGLENPPAARQADPFARQRLGGLPTRHLIGSGPELSQQPIMDIVLESQPSLVNRPLYWRGLTYDSYTGSGWETAGTTTISYNAGEIAGTNLENQRLLRQEVQPLADLGGLIYAVGTLATMDEPFQVAWRARYINTDTYTDFFAAVASDGETGTYRGDSYVPDFSEAELRSAGQDIPGWIADRYLLLPEGISDRVRALARDLTATEPTPYDRALAIEGYLRRFPYTLDLPQPPADREIADYFLFELQRGYCDYYATTMVVLARAAGLPARLATGFVGGTFDEENRRYTITADLAHSWPEIYFPGYGWIPFEPTGGRPVPERSPDAPPGSEPGSETTLEPITAARDRARRNQVARIAASILLAAAASAIAWWLLDGWRLRYLPPDQAIVRLFQRLRRSGRHLDVLPEVSETPHEFAARLAGRLISLSGHQVQRASLASASTTIAWLAELYARCLFSPYQPEAKQQREAIRYWPRLRLQLIWAALLLRAGRAIRRLPGKR